MTVGTALDYLVEAAFVWLLSFHAGPVGNQSLCTARAEGMSIVLLLLQGGVSIQFIKNSSAWKICLLSPLYFFIKSFIYISMKSQISILYLEL